MRIFGEAADRGAVISFLVGDIHHFDLGTLLDRLGIAVRTGHHCAQPLMQRLGIEGTVRASFCHVQYTIGSGRISGWDRTRQPDVLKILIAIPARIAIFLFFN